MLPHELVSRYIVPAIKALIAHSLSSRGFSQERIARLLGVSQPMVSKYLRRGPDSILGELENYGVDSSEAQRIVELLSGLLERGNIVEYYSVFTSYINTLLSRGDICLFHRSIEPRLPPSCSICRKAFSSFRDTVIVEVEEAVKEFTAHPKAYLIVPNVGSNIVAARPGAKNVSDIVGLTGGIVRVARGVEVIGSPAYGGSRHTAQILLIVYARWPSRRAGMVIAYREECIDFFSRRNLTVAKTGPHSDQSRLLDDITEIVAESASPIDVIADRGGYGLEPVIYVFDESAQKVVKTVMSCLDQL